jgi:hypothetical protein
MEDQKRRLILTGLLSLGLMLSLSAQKKELLSDQGTVEMRVAEALDAYQQSDDWAKWIEKNPVQGMFAFDITVWNKGEVVSVRALGRSDGAEISHQNALKDLLKQMKFDFKVPKGKRYKVTYNFMIE